MERSIDSLHRDLNRDRPKPNQAHWQVPLQAAPLLESLATADERAAHFEI